MGSYEVMKVMKKHFLLKSKITEVFKRKALLGL